MASEIEIMLQQLRSVDLNIAVPQIIEETQMVITEYVQEQLQEGQQSTGAKIAPSYSSGYYAKKKNQRNPKPGFGIPDLYNTGAYYKAMGVLVDKENYAIESDSSYPGLERYGENILRMSDENKSKYAQGTILEKIKERYKSAGISFS